MLTTNAQFTAHDFESIYADADRDTELIPWSDGQPSSALVVWLNAIAPSLIRCGARVAVVGCGLGEDAEELVRRGYDVTAFDCSPSAIEWARELHPAEAGCFHVADVFDLPLRWRHRFDLVVEVNAVQSLPPARRQEMMAGIEGLLSRHGRLLTICRAAEVPAETDDGPPWAMTPDELTAAAGTAGLLVEGQPSVFLDNETPPVRRMRVLFARV